MSKGNKDAPQPLEPVDVVDAVPDRTSRPAAWKFVLLAAGFAAWVAALVTALMGWAK
jgi:hypothetical protein